MNSSKISDAGPVDQGERNAGESSLVVKKRKGSAVWENMRKITDQNGKVIKAECIHCKGIFDGSSTSGTTHLKNHLKSKKCMAARLGNGGDGNKSPLAVIDVMGNSLDHQNPTPLSSRKEEILYVYQEEKVKLHEVFNKLSCRISLQFDRGSGSFKILKVHYIDDSWEQQSRIITILPIADFNYGVAIEAMKQSCLDLKIDVNICSVVYNGYVNGNDDMNDKVNSWFSQRNSLPFGGFLPEVRESLVCNISAAVLLVAKAIGGTWPPVNYTYKKLKLQNGKNLILEYVKSAVGMNEELEKRDGDHFWPIKEAATFEHLKLLLNVCDRFNNWKKSHIPIKDLPKLIYINKILVTPCCRSEDCHVCKDASGTIRDFVDLYWSRLYMVSVIVLVLDPRFTMGYVKFRYQQDYGSDADEYFDKILKDFRQVYDKYMENNSSDLYYEMLDEMGRPRKLPKSELDLYLKELKVPVVEEFDILTWWRGNAPFYPTLARMARDYLAIPSFCDYLEFRKLYLLF